MHEGQIIFTGCVSNVRTVRTKTARQMVTCTVGDKNCKAFGDVATVCKQLDEHQATIHGQDNE
jgi:hypothetical protein